MADFGGAARFGNSHKLVFEMFAPLADQFDPTLPLSLAAYRSWTSVKTWVMIWLWYLNVIYWAALAFIPNEEAVWALSSYIAVAPIVALAIVSQRGLTRLSGLIHLPWVPLTIYLAVRLFGDTLEPSVKFGGDPYYSIWLHVLFWSTLVCITLDAIDVVRWLAGERYVLGTPAAVAAGASKPARMN